MQAAAGSEWRLRECALASQARYRNGSHQGDVSAFLTPAIGTGLPQGIKVNNDLAATATDALNILTQARTTTWRLPGAAVFVCAIRRSKRPTPICVLSPQS